MPLDGLPACAQTPGMKSSPDYLLSLLSAALVGFVCFGGPGLVVAGMAGYLLKMAPYRRRTLEESSKTMRALGLVPKDKPPEPYSLQRPRGFYSNLVVAAGLMFLGLLRYEMPGLFGALLFG